jgi:hypothetical protein
MRFCLILEVFWSDFDKIGAGDVKKNVPNICKFCENRAMVYFRAQMKFCYFFVNSSYNALRSRS